MEELSAGNWKGRVVMVGLGEPLLLGDEPRRLKTVVLLR